MRVLLIGPPGAGKGTQATRIAEHFDLGNIATGALLREQVANETELGKVAKEYMDRGDLVPDDIVIEMARDRMAQAAEEGGYVLDGYPRTLAQAEAAYRWAVARGIPFDLTLYFEIEEDGAAGPAGRPGPGGAPLRRHRGDGPPPPRGVRGPDPAAGRLLPPPRDPGPHQRRRPDRRHQRADLRHPPLAQGQGHGRRRQPPRVGHR